MSNAKLQRTHLENMCASFWSTPSHSYEHFGTYFLFSILVAAVWIEPRTFEY
jgi:hypothetical protein